MNGPNVKKGVTGSCPEHVERHLVGVCYKEQVDVRTTGKSKHGCDGLAGLRKQTMSQPTVALVPKTGNRMNSPGVSL